MVEFDRAMPHERYIRRLAAEIRSTWRQMPTVWPGTDFAGLVVLVLDGGLTVVRTDGSITRGRLDEFDQRALVSGRFGNLGLTRYRGAHAVWVEIPPRVFASGDPDRWYRSFPRSTSCFAMITHEAFHHFGQSGWRDLRSPRTGPDRYPPDVEARRRRLETWRAVRNALLEPHRQSHHLGAAAWWYQEWKSSSPDEVAAVLDADVREATAQYVDQTCTVRASIGADLPPEAIDRGHRHLVDQDLVPGEVYAGTAESESYHAGAIACMLLHRFNHPTWQLDAEDGVPPLESLLGTRLGRPQEASETVDELLQRRVVPRWEGIRAPMERLIAELRTRGTRYLVFEGLPSSEGTFRSHGVYSVAGFDGVLFMPSVSGDFFVGNGRVAMRELPVISGSPVNACGCAATALAVPVPADVTLTAGRLVFRTRDVDVDVEVEAMVTDHDGRILLCVPSAARRVSRSRPLS